MLEMCSQINNIRRVSLCSQPIRQDNGCHYDYEAELIYQFEGRVRCVAMSSLAAMSPLSSSLVPSEAERGELNCGARPNCMVRN